MIYLLYGDEDYLINEEVARLKQKFKEHPSEQFEAISAANLFENLKTPGLFSANRLVLVYNFDLQDDEEVLATLAKTLDPNIELVFVSPQNLDKRKKGYKAIAPFAEMKEFKSYTDWEITELVSWLIEQINSQSKKISRKNAELLVEICGKNLMSLINEVKKIITYIGESDEIKEEDILLLASQKDIHVFAFVDALREKNIKKSLQLMEAVLRDRASTVQLVSLIASQFRSMLGVKVLQQKGLDQYAIAKRMQYGTFYIKKLLQSSSKFTLERLRAILELLYSSDLSLKRGESEQVLLPLLVEDICCG